MGSRFAGHVKAVEITDSAVMALMILALAAHRVSGASAGMVGKRGAAARAPIACTEFERRSKQSNRFRTFITFASPSRR